MADGSTLTVEIATPGRPPVRLDAVEVVLPGESGVFTVLPGHTPLLATLTHGVLITYPANGSAQFFAVHEGFVEVLEDKITVMALAVEDETVIDASRARAARERAEDRLKSSQAEIDLVRAEAALSRAMARLQAQGRQELV